MQKYTLRAAHLEPAGVDLDLAVEDDVLPLDRADVAPQVGVEREVRRGPVTCVSARPRRFASASPLRVMMLNPQALTRPRSGDNLNRERGEPTDEVLDHRSDRYRC